MDIKWLMGLTIVLAPFAAGPEFPGFGNFGSNLALLPFLGCVLFLLLRLAQGRAAISAGVHRTILLSLLIFFGWAALLTLANGARWSLDSSLLAHDVVRAAFAKATAPIFIALLLWGGFEIGRRVSPDYLESAVRFSFAIFVAYTLLQVVSAAVPNPIYSLLSAVVEADTSTNSTEAYFAQFGRVNGPSIEPAEFSRTLIIFFAPWLLISLRPNAGTVALPLLLIGCCASLSFVGLYCALWLLVCTLIFARRPAMPLLIALTGMLVVLPFGYWILQDRLFGRLLEEDLSTIIRARYAAISLELLLQHPLIGIGWSMEPLFFPDRLRDLLRVPEVLNDIATVNGLSAKSLVLRLMLYSGLPAALLLMIIATRQVFKGFAGREPFPLHARVAMILLVVFVTGIVDGGILTVFYPWLAIGLALGNAAAAQRTIAP